MQMEWKVAIFLSPLMCLAMRDNEIPYHDILRVSRSCLEPADDVFLSQLTPLTPSCSQQRISRIPVQHGDPSAKVRYNTEPHARSG